MRSFVAALPKVESHVHLLGSASSDTVLRLSRRHPECGVPVDEHELRAFYEFTDFAHFIDVYVTVNGLVRTGADIRTLIDGLAADLAANNVRYAEVTVSAHSHLCRGMDVDELAEALEGGRAAALAEHGVHLAWIFDIPAPGDEPDGMVTVDFAVRRRPQGTVGFGLGGPEIGQPRGRYARAFAIAREAGLHSVPHAGETTGPESIWSALNDLRAERIGHGTSAVKDEKLLAHLAEHAIPLEVCPTSNLRTRVVADLASHPLPRLLDAGVPVTINTDDPGMFHCDLNGEYLLCHTEFGLGRSDLADLARAGVRAAFCDDELRATLLAEIDAVEARFTR
ncbi:adenosine deaminase [Herbihabitans rhizosphaerae]|uniref:Adenosine deaminase n=1 Tax=Herbihabitans rhizosphaerae TaxID=1872711 RepID=A0A4Q7KEV7_9PSEU|nr:adenosine deaminase [Herbihabitans rhizosphaerae]RZS30590.1 adenosine deaminase [Herbihabitans rhizosphaerae]